MKHNNFQLLKEINSKATIKRYTSFILGCIIVAIAYNLFLVPNDIVAGGVSGIAIIINHLFNIENSTIILIGDIFLLVLCYFTLGEQKTKATVVGSLLFPVLVKLTANINTYLNLDTSDVLVSIVFGGLLLGIGGGMIFKAGFTTGGTDIVNQIIAKYGKMSIGKSIILSDGLIVLFSAFIFGPNKLMYSIIILYIISIISDRIILGISDSKAFYIITTEEEKVKEYILKYLNHGVTIFKGKGGYKKENEDVLMCVLPTKDYYKLKEGIHTIDKDAFFVVTDAYEVFGGE
ncbi:MAG: YitT family protein [Firmicutes bacterium]|nr:YitT family protein [Bacillota bacterium]